VLPVVDALLHGQVRAELVRHPAATPRTAAGARTRSVTHSQLPGGCWLSRRSFDIRSGVHHDERASDIGTDTRDTYRAIEVLGRVVAGRLAETANNIQHDFEMSSWHFIIVFYTAGPAR
jgi:hypothetical protein